MNNPVIGFIGVGELALYTIKGVRSGGYTGTINLSPRNREKAEFLETNYDCKTLSDNQTVVDNSDYIILATRPDDCLAALTALNLKENKTLISVVAGVSVAQLKNCINNNIEIVRAMPVSSAEAISSPTLIFPENSFVEQLFNYCGSSCVVTEESIFEQGSVLACVYSWFFALYDELIQATQSDKLPPELAGQLVMGMAKGAAELALQNKNQTPGEIADSIATEGTYSKMGLDLIKERDSFAAWQDACQLLKDKLSAP
jgi:pyrroline-5-carboxylate reductase